MKTKRKMKRPKLTDETIDYMKQWANGDQRDDIQAFAEEGYWDLVAVRLAGAGVTEENINAEEKNINAVAKAMSYRTERRLINEALKGYTIYVCNACNHHHYISKYGDFETGYACSSCLAKNNYTVEYWDELKRRTKAKGE